jgi:hypothetical protein
MDPKLKLLVAAVAAALLASGHAHAAQPPAADAVAQSSAKSSPQSSKSAVKRGWRHPKTPWGDPDLQGMWPLNHINSVPLQRPEKYGERLYFTQEELAAEAQRVAARNEQYQNEDQANRIGLGHWTEQVDVPAQTSLVVDPPNGLLPSRTALGDKMAKEMGSSWGREYWDKAEDFDSWDRCITRGLPSSMFPYPYNNGIQIVQAPGYVVINLEMIHEARIVPLGPMPKLDPAIKQWLGDSRGHWEGNTLVVETANFNGKTSMTPSTTPGPEVARPASTELRMVERFERVDDDTIQYSVTVTDPLTLTSPWTAAFPWKRDDSYQIFEYACNEDNSAIRGFISNSRVYRAQKAAGMNPTVQTPAENIRERATGVPKK